MKKIKAISLLSGGLDSILATKLVKDQKIEVQALKFENIFISSKEKALTDTASVAKDLGVDFKIIKLGSEYLEIIKNPRYGYGSNMNPCIDCRIFMLKKAKEYMKNIGASFLVTGDVLGERPMSQNKSSLQIIEKNSKLEGLILRPLSAKLLKITIPEKLGWVDRDKLMDIAGRSRKRQFELADKFKIKIFASPAGGCLLTDTNFSKRLKDLCNNNPDFSIKDIKLLKVGRHFRLSSKSKLVVGRDEKENKKILDLDDSRNLFFRPVDIKGPVALGLGSFKKEHIKTASSIVARYSNNIRSRKINIKYRKGKSLESKLEKALPINEETLCGLRI